jgi:hypothetical protein
MLIMKVMLRGGSRIIIGWMKLLDAKAEVVQLQVVILALVA